MIENSDEVLLESDFEAEPEYVPGVPDPRMGWSVMGIFNDLSTVAPWPPKVRDYISPSDIGKNYFERYQKMMGIAQTNPPDARAQRIFATGDMVHDTLKSMIKCTGLFVDSQDDAGWTVIPETPTTLKVLGKYDCLVGGKCYDLAQVEAECTRRELNKFFVAKVLAIAKAHIDKYGSVPMEELLYEFKSINSQAFWHKKDYLRKAYPHHELQLYAYLKGNNKPLGRLLYVSRDDWVTQEFPIYLGDEEIEKRLQADLEQMTYYIKNKEEPPKPPELVFSTEKKISFSKNKVKHKIEGAWIPNWEIQYSSYLTLITGCKTKNDWLARARVEANALNKVIKEEYIKSKGL